MASNGIRVGTHNIGMKLLSQNKTKKKFICRGLIEPAVAGPVWFMPWLAKLAPDTTGFTKLLEAVQDLRNEFRILIEKRREKYSREVLNDFLDYYLTEIEDTTDENSSFYKDVGGKC